MKDIMIGACVCGVVGDRWGLCDILLRWWTVAVVRCGGGLDGAGECSSHIVFLVGTSCECIGDTLIKKKYSIGDEKKNEGQKPHDLLN